MLVILCLYACVPVNRCQSSLQRTIGEPAQARDATITQASLTVTTERLHALEEKLNSKLDALTTVGGIVPNLSAEMTPNYYPCTQLLQTQTQLSQSLQEQFSHAQTQQSRVLELLAPLHSILQSVPLHINIARNAVLEKIPEGCRCRCTGYRSDPSIPSTATCCRTPLSKEDAKLSLGARKKRRISFDTPHFDPNNPPIFGYQDQPVAVEDHHTPLGIFAREPGETSASAQPQRIDTVSAVQTASGVKRGNDAVTRARDHLLLRNALSESVNARLATRQSVISRGIVPSVSALETPYASSDGQNFSNAPRVSLPSHKGYATALVFNLPLTGSCCGCSRKEVHLA